METKLQELAAKNSDSKIVTVDGAEYLLVGGSVDFFELASEHNLRINVLQQCDGETWELMPYYTMQGVSLELLIDHHFDKQYKVVYFQSKFEPWAKKYVDIITNGGASPVEIEKAVENVQSVNRMFDQDIIGHECDRNVVVSIDGKEMKIVNDNQSLVSFHGVTMAIGLSVPTPEQTKQAIEIMTRGENIPCLHGMLPEDLQKVVGDEMKKEYDLKMVGGDSDDERFSIGPFLIIDEDGWIGYAFRMSWDGEHWAWVGGDHSNFDSMSHDDFEDCKYYPSLIRSFKDRHFVAWHPIKNIRTDRHGLLFSLPM